jgi:hypothetical protein
MADPILALDTCSEEEAVWVEVAEAELLMAQGFVRRALSVARGYVLAARAGRGDLAVADVMGSLSLDRGSAESVLSQALCVAAHPATAQALEDGRLGLAQGRALLEVLDELPAELADRVEVAALADLSRLAGRSPSRMRELARQQALRLDPDGARERRTQAAKKRHLGLRDAGDGMALLSLLVRAEHGLAVLHRAEQQTRHDDGSGRTRDQRRADWVIDTLLTDPAGSTAAAASPSQTVPGAELVRDGRRRRPVQVLVHVPVTTALGLDDEPCQLAEIGPVDAAHGRLLLSTAELRKVCVDAVTGQVLHVEDSVVRPVADPRRVVELGGSAQARSQALSEAVRQAVLDMVASPSVMPVEPEDGYLPSASLSRTVKTRHPRCDFLSCGTSSRSCDDEHDRPWQRGGQTSADNLRPRSRWCHRAKQRGWTAAPLADGSTLWISPSGRQYPAPRQHEPPPSLPEGARLRPPLPPPPRDDDGPTGLEFAVEPPWPPPLSTAENEPEPPPSSGWPDDVPF